MTWNPAPPPPDAGPAPTPSPYFDAIDFPGIETAAAVAMVLNEFLRSLPLVEANPAAGALRLRDVMREAKLAWPDVLTARTGAYTGQLRLYGHVPPLSPTALDRCGPTPPEGRGPDLNWRPGWIGVCAQAVAERVAWVPPLVLVEMALLAGMAGPTPMPWQVERADALMRSVWREPVATYPLED